MPTKHVPADERVQVLTADMVDESAFTIRAPSEGPDLRFYSYETDDSDGFLLRSGDELPVEEDDSFLPFDDDDGDGLWFETVGDLATELEVLKGVALRRNPRRRQTVEGTNGVLQTTTDGEIETDNYGFVEGIDIDGTSYPYTVDPEFTIQEWIITQSGGIVVEIETTTGDTATVPLEGATVAVDTISVERLTLRDPDNTGARIAGVVVGE